MRIKLKIIISGLIAGSISEAVLGGLFMSPPVKSLLYNPAYQSETFILLTPTRDFIPSITGIVILSVVHSWLFSLFQPSIPGNSWYKKGIIWGLTIWIMYWLFQEWFIYHTLLNEPILLNLFELLLLLIGSLVEGLIISKFLYQHNT